MGVWHPWTIRLFPPCASYTRSSMSLQRMQHQGFIRQHSAMLKKGYRCTGHWHGKCTSIQVVQCRGVSSTRSSLVQMGSHGYGPADFPGHPNTSRCPRDADTMDPRVSGQVLRAPGKNSCRGKRMRGVRFLGFRHGMSQVPVLPPGG